jgi:prepilin-type processing-associated H-X9-DG protein
MSRQVQAVVVLMLVIGAGMILPAVVQIREAGRRVGCASNLRLLGLALHGYHAVSRTFPPGTILNSELPPEKRLSWARSIWGFIEARPELLIDNSKAWDADENREPKEHFRPPKFPEDKIEAVGDVPVFLCPGNPQRLPADLPAVLHYVGIAGVGSEAAALADDERAGVFGYDRHTRRQDIMDGEAVTLLLAETALDNGPWTAGGPSTVRGLDPARQPYLGSGRQFGGTHLGVANSLFADGSVRFLNKSIDAKLFEVLATKAGGERVELGNY